MLSIPFILHSLFINIAMGLLTLVLCFFCVWALLVFSVSAEVGTATSYGPPYLPTKCPGYNEQQLPEDGMFVAANPGIWDNGAACGRQYRLRCLSGPMRPCKDDGIIVEVVDLCKSNPCPSTMVLSDKAFDAVSKIPLAKINIEFIEI